MRILQVIQSPQLRGAEIFACQLAEELNKGGDTVDVLYLFESTKSRLDFNLTLIALHGDKKRRFWDFGAFKRLANLVETGKYDIVQANAGDTLKYTVFSRLLFRWRAKIIFRNASIMSEFIRGRVQMVFNLWLLSQCDYFISVSEHSRRDLMRLYRHAAPASITIPNGTRSFDHIPAVTRNSSQQEPVFIAISSFVPEKNHVFLLEIFNLYCQRSGKGYLWLVGDGELKPLLQEKIAQYGLKNRVHFWGSTNDAIAILKAADVLLMPSLIEGLPGAILEAISCEVPVVASDVGGIPEIIEDDVTGICIRGWSADFYVQRISALLNDREYRDRLVRQAKIKLLEKYTVEKVAAGFARVYKRLPGI